MSSWSMKRDTLVIVLRRLNAGCYVLELVLDRFISSFLSTKVQQLYLPFTPCFPSAGPEPGAGLVKAANECDIPP